MSTRRITEFLNGNRVKYAIITHSPAYTAQEVAASVHVPGQELAKTVVVNIDGEMVMAVVPATRWVDLTTLRLVTAANYAEITEEAAFAERFDGCQLGAMPPFGNLFGMNTFVDRSLARDEFISFNAGSHTEVISMRFADFRRLVHPKLVNISMPMPPAGVGPLRA